MISFPSLCLVQAEFLITTLCNLSQAGASPYLRPQGLLFIKKTLHEHLPSGTNNPLHFFVLVHNPPLSSPPHSLLAYYRPICLPHHRNTTPAPALLLPRLLPCLGTTANLVQTTSTRSCLFLMLLEAEANPLPRLHPLSPRAPRILSAVSCELGRPLPVSHARTLGNHSCHMISSL